MKFSNRVLLILIVLIGALLRFYKLGEVPTGLYVDEAAIGYNAFSLAKTGVDEYGQVLPIFLRSFSAFSSPLYVYLSALPISLFGLSAFSVRVLSALSGTLNVILIYLIVDKVFKYKSRLAPAFAAFVFAISPWSIFFSRGAFEANLGLLLLSISIYLMLFRNNIKYLVISSVVLGISAYAYHSLRFIPLLLIPIHYLLFRSKKYTLRHAVSVFAIFIVVIAPQIIISMTPAFGSRAVGLFYSDVVSAQASKIVFAPGFLSSFLALAREFSSQIIAYFSPANLFLLGDSDLQRSIPEMGVFYWWVMAPYLVGMYALAKKLPDKKAIFVFVLMLIFAAPAALARDPFSSLRALNLLIPFSVVIALGFDSLMSTKGGPASGWGRIGIKKFAVIFAALVLISLLNFWRGYFVLFANERASLWNYGYKQLAEKIERSQEHFVVDNSSRIKPPHILLAFHMKIPPQEYQGFARAKIIKGYYQDIEFDTYYALRNFETRPIDWENDIYKEQILVGDELAISQEQIKEHKLEEVFKIYDPMKKLVFQGYRTNPEAKCRMIDYKDNNCQ